MILLTGASGFIGQNIKASLQKKTEVITCDLNGGDIYPTDLFPYLKKQMIDIEGIIHLGAITSTREKDLIALSNNNVQMTLELFRWATRNNKKLIYASSAATYGDGSKGYYDEDSVGYLSSLEPLNPYGRSKAAADVQIFREIEECGKGPPQLVGLKFFNVYGPHEEHKGDMRSVASKLYGQIKNGEAAKLFKSYKDLYEDGGQLRDFVYVKDCCDVIEWFLGNEVSGIFNVGSGKARTFNDVATLVFSSLGLDPNIEYIDMPEDIKAHYQYFTEAPMTKLRGCGYPKEFTSLEDGVKDYVNYLENTL